MIEDQGVTVSSDGRAGGPSDLSRFASQPEALIPNAVYLEVEADVRYWEDAIVNDKTDDDGSLIPFRERNTWHPWIDLAEGRVADWPRGTEADIHYKVCDQGLYWLTDREGRRLAKWRGHYVPNDFLCHGGKGYGDYIILSIAKDGSIANWERPEIVTDEWQLLASGTEARRAETGTGSVHDGPIAESETPKYL